MFPGSTVKEELHLIFRLMGEFVCDNFTVLYDKQHELSPWSSWAIILNALHVFYAASRHVFRKTVKDSLAALKTRRSNFIQTIGNDDVCLAPSVWLVILSLGIIDAERNDS